MSDTALRLADAVEQVAKWSDSEHWDTLEEAAAELRRLHALVEEDSILLRRKRDEIAALKAENESLKLDLDGWADLHNRFMDNHVATHALNDELVEALHQIRAHTLYSPTGAVHLIASAALAKVEVSK